MNDARPLFGKVRTIVQSTYKETILRAIINVTMTNAVFTMSFSVGPDDIDLLNHVNNRVYLRWMEEAATAHAARCGWTFGDLKKVNRAWVARQHWIEYLKPALLGDNLTLYTWVQSSKRFSSLRRYALKRGNELLTVGATEWVLINLEKRTPVSCDLPSEAALVDCFDALAPGHPALKTLGLVRMVRFAPSPGL